MNIYEENIEDIENTEPSVHESNIRDDLGDENDLENENEEDGEKDDAESVDSIEQQRTTYKFDKPRSWELQPVRIANVWDCNPDVVIYKWVKGSSFFPHYSFEQSEIASLLSSTEAAKSPSYINASKPIAVKFLEIMHLWKSIN